MEPITEAAVRKSFVNCTKGEATRMNLPREFAELPWPDLDFLGWRDPSAPERAWLVAEHRGGLVGVSLRAANNAGRGFTATGICSICTTARTGGGVVLLTARRTGDAGRQGNSVGQHMCSDLACPLYVRGKKKAAASEIDESLTLAERVERMRVNLAAFLDKITAG